MKARLQGLLRVTTAAFSARRAVITVLRTVSVLREAAKSNMRLGPGLDLMLASQKLHRLDEGLEKCGCDKTNHRDLKAISVRNVVLQPDAVP